jgi:predicted ATP-grasp superfamily ATP-dependent carboligase
MPLWEGVVTPRGGLSRRLRRMALPSASAPPPGRVLVTDGEFKHTLGIARQLARRGHEVHLLAQSARAPAIHSRAVARWHLAPSPGAPEYDARLLEIVRSLAPLSVVPVGNGAVAAADRLRDSLPRGATLALPPRESLATASDKARTAALARSLGVSTPRERRVESIEEARGALAAFGAPLVLKSAREEGVKAVRYARDPAGLAPAFEAVRALAGGAVLAQEHIAGEGFGFSALYWNGAQRRSLMHRRVREWPPSGGTSACAESIEHAPALERAGTALLDALAWHGVAMVEFKGALDGGPLALIEINAKFWGSLDVALAAGVDFPGDLVALLEGRALPPAGAPRRVRFSWPFGGDLWHGLFRPASLPAVLLDALSPRVAHSFSLRDPLPLFYEIAQWARSTPGAWREARAMR